MTRVSEDLRRVARRGKLLLMDPGTPSTGSIFASALRSMRQMRAADPA
jgi:hypothetical protein